jgi:hypothetical protein
LKLPLVAVAVALAAGSGASSVDAKLPPLRDPVFLNIGFVCQWDDACMTRQKRAMKKALSYTKKSDPPGWKVQLCNRRAVQRRSGRIDWVSYNNCIRSPALAPRTAASRNRR